jgi:hypothetical protein
MQSLVMSDNSPNTVSGKRCQWKVRSQLVREEMLPSAMGVEERQTKLE